MRCYIIFLPLSPFVKIMSELYHMLPESWLDLLWAHHFELSYSLYQTIALFMAFELHESSKGSIDGNIFTKSVACFISLSSLCLACRWAHYKGGNEIWSAANVAPTSVHGCLIVAGKSTHLQDASPRTVYGMKCYKLIKNHFRIDWFNYDQIQRWEFCQDAEITWHACTCVVSGSVMISKGTLEQKNLQRAC